MLLIDGLIPIETRCQCVIPDCGFSEQRAVHCEAKEQGKQTSPSLSLKSPLGAPHVDVSSPQEPHTIHFSLLDEEGMSLMPSPIREETMQFH